MSTNPTVIVGGYAYRLGRTGVLEHTEAQRITVPARRWPLVTEASPDAERAAVALLVLHDTINGSITHSSAFDRVTVACTDLGQPTPTPFTSPEAIAAGRRRRENARDLLRIQAKHGELLDARAIAAEKGLKLWNGGELPSFIRLDHEAVGLRHNENIHLYGCAPSRLALIRMVAELRGGDGRGVSTRITKYWSEGAWGVHMAGIEPEPGLWVQHRHTDKPVRVWPKESAE